MVDQRFAHVNPAGRDFVFEEAGRFGQVPDGNDLQPVHHVGLGGIFGRHGHADLSFVQGAQGGRHDAFDRVHSLHPGGFAHRASPCQRRWQHRIAGSNSPRCRGGVERTFGWLMRHRRLVRDYERTEASAESWIHLALIRIQLRRLA